MSFYLNSILAETKTSLIKYLDNLINLFDGYNREWQIHYGNQIYSKPFFINTPLDIMRKADFNNLNTFEIAFSVQKFNSLNTNSFYDWDFIIDIDNCTLEQRKQICKEITQLLDDFNIAYLIDSRYHIWTPTWTHSLTENWNQLYNRNFAYYMKTFIEACTDIKGKCTLDTGLWYINRHKIRCPYTYHLESKKLQIFYDSDFKPLKMKEVEQTWNGTKYTLTEKEKICLGFNDFINYAIDIGKSLYEGLNIQEKIIEEHVSIRNKQLRPCFAHALKHNTNMTHQHRMATVLEALASGYRDPIEIAKLFSNQSDFKLEISLYQVNDIIKRTKIIKPYRCKTIQQKGWCIKEKCKIYKNIK